MNSYSFLAAMRGFEMDLESSPEMQKVLMQLLELVEETQEHVRVLLVANKKLLDVVEALKKK